MIDGIDKLVVDYLRGLVDTLKTDDAMWVNLFPDYTDDLRARLRDAFRGSLPTVREAYPRSKALWPVWFVPLQAESPEHDYIGHKELPVRREDDADIDVFGMGVSDVIQIMVVSEGNPNICRWHSLVAKRGMMAGMAYFHQFTGGVNYMGMGDFVPDPRYLPENLFGREQRWQFEEEDVVMALTPEAILRGAAWVAIQGVPIDGGKAVGAVIPDEVCPGT